MPQQQSEFKKERNENETQSQQKTKPNTYTLEVSQCAGVRHLKGGVRYQATPIRPTTPRYIVDDLPAAPKISTRFLL